MRLGTSVPALAHRVVACVCMRASNEAKGNLITAIFSLLYMRIWLRLLANVCQDAAIYVENMPINEVAGIAGEEHGRSHEVFGSAPTSGRSFGKDELVERMTAAIGLQFAQRSCLRRGDIARTDAVALYVASAKF